jgi:hypothetical protein
MRDLDGEISDLAPHLDWPEHDIARQVATRLQAGPEPLPVRFPRRRVVAMLAVAAAVATVAGVAVLSQPGTPTPTRRALPTTTTAIVQSDPGTLMSLSDARTAVGIHVLVPTIYGMSRPDEVRVAHPPTTGEVSLVYRSRTGLPAADDAGVGMVIAMFKGQLDVASFDTLLGPGTRVEATTVQGVPGYWIEGAPKAFGFIDGAGNLRTQSFRLGGSVLLWQRNGLTLRIESALALDQAVRVADSMK